MPADEWKIISRHITPRYYSSKKEFRAIHVRLKLMPCPYCRRIGALVLHGYLRGYDERSAQAQIVRGRRIFCNNRKARHNGCGRTFSILAATVLRTFSISATSLWRFLRGISDPGDRLPSFRKQGLPFHASAAYRLWKRFVLAQARIRAFLTRHCPRPELPVTPCAATQTIAHLRAAFKGAACPIAAFQHRFQASFL